MRSDDAWEERVLANFMEAGRIKQIPARWKKRRVVLRWLAEHFRPAERYPEPQVNDILRRYHEDFALLRRLLVDEELMQRQAGLYWRAGTLPFVIGALDRVQHLDAAVPISHPCRHA